MAPSASLGAECDEFLRFSALQRIEVVWRDFREMDQTVAGRNDAQSALRPAGGSRTRAKQASEVPGEMAVIRESDGEGDVG